MSKKINKLRLYRTIWRWHFYAGIFCIPFVITLSISGAIFLFKPQIDHWIDKPYHQLTVETHRASPDEHIHSTLQAIPNSTFLNYQIPESKSHAVIISVIKEGIRHLVYINPYSLEVLKTTEYNQQFIRLVRSFHGEPLSGNIG